ncbi:MAG TPA: universal stress protein [Casimicrobiaceae bacterium]|jgi:nucleotide-binding universal stress UspA family protein|nr:universal stress protein [Casimicrobiaceae bacterium]
MVHVLLPVDGSVSSTHAVRMVIALYLRLAPVGVTLLHVRVEDDVPDARVDANAATRFASPDDALAEAKALLAQAGVPYDVEERAGYVGSTIVECAKAVNCDVIVMGTRGMGSTGELLGSVARQVVSLAEVPVTLVK